MDFDAAFDRHHPAVFRYLYRLTGDPDRADDLAQETFVRLLEHEVDPERVEAWLYTVATNLVRDRGRRRTRRRELMEGEEVGPGREATPDEALEREETRRRVRRALDALKPRDRQMLLMREEGFSYAEIAGAVSVAETSVGALLARALARFEEAYRSRDGEEGPASG